MAINHKWNGAAPSFIKRINTIIIWCCNNIIEDNKKIIDAIAWNKKYFTGCVEGFNSLEIIKSKIKLNILTSMHNQIINKEDLITETIKLIKFIKILNITNKGEIKLQITWAFELF